MLQDTKSRTRSSVIAVDQLTLTVTINMTFVNFISLIELSITRDAPCRWKFAVTIARSRKVIWNYTVTKVIKCITSC